MRSIFRSVFILTGVVCCTLFTVSQLPAFSQAQDSPDKTVEKTETKPRKAPRGRLPNFYTQVVNGEQRETIYNIQSKFTPQIEKLEAEIEALKAKMNEEVEKVLTPEQKKRVDDLRAEAEAKRKEAAKSKEPPTEKRPPDTGKTQTIPPGENMPE